MMLGGGGRREESGEGGFKTAAIEVSAEKGSCCRRGRGRHCRVPLRPRFTEGLQQWQQPGRRVKHTAPLCSGAVCTPSNELSRKHLQEAAPRVYVNCCSPTREGQRRSLFAMLERRVQLGWAVLGTLASIQFIHE